MLIDIIAHHARWSGDQVALVARDGEQYSYSRSYAAIVALANALHSQFPELPGKIPVAVAFSDRRQHLLLTLALEYLGVASLPFVIPLDPGVGEALQQCSVLISDQALATFPGRQILLDGPWFQSAERTTPRSDLQCARWLDHEIVMLIVTSGSTGAAKCIRLGYQARLLREANRAWRYGFSPATHYLVGLPISVSNVLISARAVLRSGGTVVFLNDESMQRAFDGITHTTLLPAHVRTILAALPEQYRHPQPIRLLSIGAPLPEELRQRAALVLSAEVESNYGCNELGGIGQIDATGIGHLFPGTEMKIVDARLDQVASGTAGVIWLRNAEIAEGYTDEASTRAQFVDGWFVTGDYGMVLGPGTFRLLGRVDELMNLGGQKVAPDPFESGLFALGIARDVAVTSIPGTHGIEQICICLEQPLVDNTALLKHIGSVFGDNTGDIAVIFVDRIPRNATGKIQRRQMHDIAMARTAK